MRAAETWSEETYWFLWKSLWFPIIGSLFFFGGIEQKLFFGGIWSIYLKTCCNYSKAASKKTSILWLWNISGASSSALLNPIQTTKTFAGSCFTASLWEQTFLLPKGHETQSQGYTCFGSWLFLRCWPCSRGLKQFHHFKASCKPKPFSSLANQSAFTRNGSAHPASQCDFKQEFDHVQHGKSEMFLKNIEQN